MRTKCLRYQPHSVHLVITQSLYSSTLLMQFLSREFAAVYAGGELLGVLRPWFFLNPLCANAQGGRTPQLVPLDVHLELILLRGLHAQQRNVSRGSLGTQASG